MLNSKKESLKKFAYEFFVSTTCHGLPNIMRTENILLKIFWLLCLLASSVLCSIVVIQSVNEYLEFDVVTKIRVKNEKSTTFPAITLCHMNPFSTKSGNEFFSNLLRDQINSSLTSSNEIINHIERTKIQAKYKINSLEFDQQKRKSFTIPIEDMLFFCSFISFECNHTFFDYLYNSDFGNCYQFKYGFETTFTGENGGLYLILFVSNSMNNYFANGLRVFIHNPQRAPAYSDEVHIKPNTKANIGIKKTVTIKEPSPYSDCTSLDTFDSFLYQETIKHFKIYNQEDCFNLCYQKSITKNCQCAHGSYPDLFNVNKSCTQLNELKCIKDELRNYKNDYCIEECPNECNATVYDFLLSSSEFLSEKYYDSLKDDFNLSGRDLLSNILGNGGYGVVLNINYRDFKYSEISESPKMSSVELLANIGGTLGLFLGVSLLSFVELVELFVNLVIVVFAIKV